LLFNVKKFQSDYQKLSDEKNEIISEYNNLFNKSKKVAQFAQQLKLTNKKQLKAIRKNQQDYIIIVQQNAALLKQMDQLKQTLPEVPPEVDANKI
jgi:alpha-galactosidase